MRYQSSNMGEWEKTGEIEQALQKPCRKNTIILSKIKANLQRNLKLELFFRRSFFISGTRRQLECENIQKYCNILIFQNFFFYIKNFNHESIKRISFKVFWGLFKFDISEYCFWYLSWIFKDVSRNILFSLSNFQRFPTFPNVFVLRKKNIWINLT